MLKQVILIISASLMLTACNKKPDEEIGYGSINNGIYTNSYFNISIKMPSDWVVQSKAQQAQLMDSGRELLSGDDNNLNRILKESEKQTVNLFSVFKYEIGSATTFNPSIISVAENVANMPGIKRGSDYHFHVKKLLNMSKIKYEFPDDIFSKDISGVSFDIMPAYVNMGTATVHQEYYAARINDYVLGFVLSYTTDEQHDELNNIMKSMSFSK